MPRRDDVFQNNDYYHIYNKTIDRRNVFATDMIAREFITTFLYYRSIKSHLRYSKYKLLDSSLQDNLWRQVICKKYFRVQIVAYCIMPNHYHFLIKQVRDNGIVTFMANILNSITRYFNILNKRRGPIFLTQFKSKKIYTEEQLVYVSRYIHTNPFASSLVDRIEDVFTYPYSSFLSYIKRRSEQISSEVVMQYFGNKIQNYKNFVINNADEQKEIEYIKYTDKWSKWLYCLY